MNKNPKYLTIELDIYERKYITINDINYITYSDEYVNAYVGKPPPSTHDYNENNIPFVDYPNMYNEKTGTSYMPMSYKDICVSYTKRLLVIFDRIKGNLKLQTPVRFNRDDTIKIYWKILDSVSYLRRFLRTHDRFRNVVMDKMEDFEQEVQNERGINKIPFKRLKCLKARIKNSILT